MIEAYSMYEFEIIKGKEGWNYIIYDADLPVSPKNIIRESSEWFEAEQEARFAAIGHIQLLENGEG